MKKKAIFPGSFDPYTKGHHSIILNALKIFDEVIIAIGSNELKNTSKTSPASDDSTMQLRIHLRAK